jgi:hypothetical protein
VSTTVKKRFFLILFGLILAVGFIVPASVLGAGDDCPPPSEGPSGDPATDNPTSDPTGSDGTDTTGDGDETANDGLFGSLGVSSSSNLTIGIMVVVGVIVCVVYLVMVGRVGEDD